MTEPAESVVGMPSTAAGRALLVLMQDVENGLQEPIEDLTSAILAIEEQARLAVAPDARYRAALDRLAKRHEWQPDAGPCICDEHLYARALLSEPKPASPAVEGE